MGRTDEWGLRGPVRKKLGRPPLPKTPRSALNRMFSLAAKQTPPKVLRAPHVPRLREDNMRTGFFEHDEFLSLRGALPDCCKVPATIGYHLGFRISEVLNLRWDQVDIEARRIVLNVGTTKNDAGKIAFMPDDLQRHLQAWKKYGDTMAPTARPLGA